MSVYMLEMPKPVFYLRIFCGDCEMEPLLSHNFDVNGNEGFKFEGTDSEEHEHVIKVVI